MNRQVIPIAVMEVEVSKQRKRQAPKGRRVDRVRWKKCSACSATNRASATC